MKKRHQQKLVFIAAVLLLLWNSPLLSLFEKKGDFLGFPVLYAYVFGSWLIVLLTVFGIIRKHHE